jgi:hypothetical protein
MKRPIEIFGFKQNDLIEYNLEVFHAFILRILIDLGKKRFHVDDVFNLIPIVKKDIVMLMSILADLEKVGLITFTQEMEPDDQGVATYTYFITIEMPDSVFSKSNDALFEKFWEIYGMKKGTAKCKALFKKLSAVDIELIFAHLPSYVKSTLGPKDKEDKANWKPRRKYPEGYLNGKMWLDGLEVEKSELDKLRESAI